MSDQVHCILACYILAVTVAVYLLLILILDSIREDK